jgi:hypothetical protein
MRNCKVGDLAIIVKDEAKMENLGLIVRVLSACGEKSWSAYNWKKKCYYKRKTDRLFTWRVEVVSETGQIIYSDGFDNLYGLRVGDMPDLYLRPLPKLIEENLIEETCTI